MRYLILLLFLIFTGCSSFRPEIKSDGDSNYVGITFDLERPSFSNSARTTQAGVKDEEYDRLATIRDEHFKVYLANVEANPKLSEDALKEYHLANEAVARHLGLPPPALAEGDTELPEMVELGAIGEKFADWREGERLKTIGWWAGTIAAVVVGGDAIGAWDTSDLQFWKSGDVEESENLRAASEALAESANRDRNQFSGRNITIKDAPQNARITASGENIEIDFQRDTGESPQTVIFEPIQ